MNMQSDMFINHVHVYIECALISNKRKIGEKK